MLFFGTNHPVVAAIKQHRLAHSPRTNSTTTNSLGNQVISHRFGPTRREFTIINRVAPAIGMRAHFDNKRRFPAQRGHEFIQFAGSIGPDGKLVEVVINVVQFYHIAHTEHPHIGS